MRLHSRKLTRRLMGLSLAVTCGLALEAQVAARPPVDFRRRTVSIARPLVVDFIDVEGGQATLFVTPDKHSLLIDTGWPGHQGRDAARILTAMQQAGIDHLDDVLLTHFHQDHAGGVPALASRTAIGAFIDHGENRQPDDAATADAWRRYQEVLAARHIRHILARPGEPIPIPGLKVTIVSADGDLIQAPLPGAGEPNPYCGSSPIHPGDQTENPRSVGVVIEFGRARLLDLGDLTWDKERGLMCPVNKLGRMDVYIVSHHGTQASNSPALVDGIRPRIAIMDNGETKGGSPQAWETVERAPGLEDLWQLHTSAAGGTEHNVPAARIANLPGGRDGYNLRLSVFPDGRLVVYSSRTGATREYR